MKEKLINLDLKARNELDETEEDTPTRLDQLRRLIAEEKNLHCPLDEEFLLRFLRARKFNVERTIKLVRRYYEMRSKNPELFEDLCPESISHVLQEKIQAVMDNRDAEGRQIFLFRAGNWNPDTVNLDDVFRSNYLFLEEMTASKETQVCGVVAIVDFEGMTFYQARQFTPKHAIRMVQIIQDSFPCRFKEFHMVNQPQIFNFLFAVVKPFLSDKIKNRIHFHGQSLPSLHSKINPEILPDCLGGKLPIEEIIQSFNQRFLQRNNHYRDILMYGYQQ